MTTIVNIHDAKTHLSRLVERAGGGADHDRAGGVPVAMLVAIEPRPAAAADRAWIAARS